MSRYIMVIDTRRCVGCMDCVVACKTENDVPEGFCRDWITETVRGEHPTLQMEIRSERWLFRFLSGSPREGVDPGRG